MKQAQITGHKFISLASRKPAGWGTNSCLGKRRLKLSCTINHSLRCLLWYKWPPRYFYMARKIQTAQYLTLGYEDLYHCSDFLKKFLYMFHAVQNMNVSFGRNELDVIGVTTVGLDKQLFSYHLSRKNNGWVEKENVCNASMVRIRLKKKKKEIMKFPL